MDSRKASITEKAGPGYADPDYEPSVEWKAARAELERAERWQQDPASPSQVLVIIGSSRTTVPVPARYTNPGGWPNWLAKSCARPAPSQTCSISAC